MSNNTEINTKYKDRLFNFIFGREENREWTLSLYNAVNGSDYTDASQIEFNTLSDVLFLRMRNDTSFIISDIMSVYEHQSTYNPNMPLRLLQYVGDLYGGYIAKHKLNKYGKKLINLPVPKLVVFYNGEKDTADESVLRLSDSFPEENKKKADIEVTVRMVNINYGRNIELMKYCKPLEEYSWFVDEVRSNQNNHDLTTSVKLALDSMPKDYMIREFLVTNRQEVEGMLDTEYNEAEVMELFKAEGKEEGIEEGSLRTLVRQVIRKIKKDKTVEEIVEDLEEDKETIERIYNTAQKYAPEYDEDKIVDALMEID